jgi:GAF domain-containing protein
MAESLSFAFNAGRIERCKALIPQVLALTAGEPNLTANQANLVAALREATGWFWIGFYLVEGDELVLGPFQGPIACTRIKKGKGVCGSAWMQEKVLVVPDVEQFPGHIACSSLSKSEVVIPIYRNGVIAGVLDVDSEVINDFSQEEAIALEEVLKSLEGRI